MVTYPLSPNIRAALWMFGAIMSFMAMALSGRELSAELKTFEILFFRSVIGLVIVALLLHRAGWTQVRTRAFGKHFVRNVAHFGGQYGWFYGLAFIPLTEVFAIEFTTPIWTAILATFFLGERMNAMRILAIVVGFIGTLVILRPGASMINPATLAVLGSAFAYAISSTLTKRLSDTETPFAILFYMTAIQLPLAMATAMTNWVWPSARLWPWIAVVAITALSAHYCLARAFRLADATLIAPLDFLRLPLIAVAGWIFYGEALNPWVIVGAVIVFCGTWLNLRSTASSNMPSTRRISQESAPP
jgi:drug/metabolite transporter (DMT)-like permease